jgi:hypothetical protein
MNQQFVYYKKAIQNINYQLYTGANNCFNANGPLYNGFNQVVDWYCQVPTYNDVYQQFDIILVCAAGMY